MPHPEQAYLDKFFPNGHELPQDRLIPALLMQNERTEVMFLVKAGEPQAALLTPERDAMVSQTDISVQLMDTPDKTGVSDLRIGLELSYPDAVVRFHAVIADETGQKQASLATALLGVRRIAFFFTDANMQFISFKAFDWQPEGMPHLQKIMTDINRKGTCT
ncbi:MAG: hypothetical protein K0Q90_2999 [Paenibacillaceae bacterium]|jgi:hypothetical protein|nr:hypothetical protein [Paenibacillaceae bacterium]